MLSTLDTSLSFSARIEYSLPDGYVLTSARGLSVNAPVPEISSWILMLAGLASLVVMRPVRGNPAGASVARPARQPASPA